MGRPLNSKFFGAGSAAGKQIVVKNAWIPGESGSSTDCIIIKQTGSNSFLVQDTETDATGIVTLSALGIGPPDFVIEGTMNVEVFPYGAPTTPAAAQARMEVNTVAIAAGGSGYSVGNILTLVGGTGTPAATFTVSSVDGGGAVTGVTITNSGMYFGSIPATGPRPTTGGAGTGATLSLTYKVNAILTNGGAGYVSATVAFSSGAATATAVVTNGVLSFTIQNAGSYTAIPTVTITAPASSTFAEKIWSNKVFTTDGNVYLWNKDGSLEVSKAKISLL